MLCIGSLILALALAEFVFRAFGIEPPPRIEGEGAAITEPAKDPALIYRLRPGAIQTVRHRDSSNGPTRTATMTVNSNCYRGAVVPMGKRDGIYRIVCVGDSYTYGFGVNDAETWPAQLETILARAPHPEFDSIQVLNFGVPGYDTAQEVHWLRRQALSWKPDLVLLCFFLNDAAIRGGAAKNAHDSFEFGEPPAWFSFLQSNEMVGKARSFSRVIDVVVDRGVRAARTHLLADSTTRLYTEDSPGWVCSRERIVDLERELKGANIRFGVVLCPLLVRRGRNLESHAAYAVVRKFLDGKEIPCIDLEPAFVGEDVDRLRVHANDSHPNAAAHGIAAERIAHELTERGWLRPFPSESPRCAIPK